MMARVSGGRGDQKMASRQKCCEGGGRGKKEGEWTLRGKKTEPMESNSELFWVAPFKKVSPRTKEYSA